MQVGTPLTVVSYLLGHTTIAMTMRYAHVDSDQARNGINQLKSRLRAEEEGITGLPKNQRFLKNPEIFYNKLQRSIDIISMA